MQGASLNVGGIKLFYQSVVLQTMSFGLDQD